VYRLYCSLSILCTGCACQLIIKENDDDDDDNNCDANWHKWSTGQGHKMINFGAQEIESQRHTRPKIDLMAWRRHSRSLVAA